MENLQIKIVITDGVKESKSSIDFKQYKMMKELHGESIIDLMVEELLEEIEKGQ
jgi:hypothetical protein